MNTVTSTVTIALKITIYRVEGRPRLREDIEFLRGLRFPYTKIATIYTGNKSVYSVSKT